MKCQADLTTLKGEQLFVTTPHGSKPEASGMTQVYRPTPTVRFMHTGEQPLKSNWCLAWHDLEHGRVFTHGPAPWNPAKRDSVENVQKNYAAILLSG